MNGVSSIKWDKVAQGFAIALTVLAVLAATVTAVAFFIFSAPIIMIVGGIAVTALLTGGAIALFVKSHFLRKAEMQNPPPPLQRPVQIIPVPPAQRPDASRTSNSSANSFSTFAPQISSPVAPSQPVPPKKISFTAFVDIHSTRTGLLGKPSQQQLMPEYLKKIYAEDGSLLMRDEKEMLIECSLSDCSFNKFPRDTVWLPARLFIGKEYGDSVRFQYDGKMIQLNISKKYSWDSFKSALDILFASQPDYPLFGIYDRNAWYGLGEKGSIYKWSKAADSEQSVIQEADAKCLRQKNSPSEVNGDVLKYENHILFIIEFPGFDLADLDLIINEKYLILYGISEQMGVKRERIFKFNWKDSGIFSCTLEEMKQKILTSKFVILHGQLQIYLSDSEASTEVIRD